MASTSTEDGLVVVDETPVDDVDSTPVWRPADSGELESLRDEFVDGFNARDVEALLSIVDRDVELPDAEGDGSDAFREELEAIWDRAPGALLTRAFLDDDSPCAVAWRPDEDGCWSRVALVCFDAEDGLLTVVALPEDAGALDRAAAEDPTGEELEEWSDWAEWDRGEESETGGRR